MMKSSFQAVALLLSLEDALGHGSTEFPPSRHFGCASKKTPERPNAGTLKGSEGCKKIAGPPLWEPQSVGSQTANGKKSNIPAGKLCSAGLDDFSTLDTTPAKQFTATRLEPNAGGKKFTMKYWYTVVHKTLFHRVYMTKPAWDYRTASPALTWNDLEDQPFCAWESVKERTTVSPTSWGCPFPNRPKGSQVMFVGFWQRSDSPEAFIACSDVIIGGSGSGGAVGGVQPKPTISKTSKPKTTIKEARKTTTKNSQPSPSPKKDQGKLSKFPNPSIHGYITSWSPKKVGSVEEMGKNGYNVAYLSFGRVAGTKVDLFGNGTIGPNGTFKYSGKQDRKTPIVILSLGGANHATWKPDFGKAKELAQNMVTYCAKNALHGVDFDLEGASPGILASDVTAKYDKVRDLIAKIRSEAESQASEFPRGFFITAAPQTHTQSNKLYWAGAKAQDAVFDEMLKPNACGGRACFDAVLIQNYNALKMTPKHAWLDITKPLLKGNEFTQVIMGYDLAQKEWGGNFPVKLRDDKTETSSAIVSASDFAKGNYSEVTGVFVWTADDDAHGGGERNGSGEPTAGNYAWAKAMQTYYPTNGTGSKKEPAPQPDKSSTAPPPATSQKKKPAPPEKSQNKKVAPLVQPKPTISKTSKPKTTIKEARKTTTKNSQPSPSPKKDQGKLSTCSACAGKIDVYAVHRCKTFADKTSCKIRTGSNVYWWSPKYCKKSCCEKNSCGRKKK